jgi:branched-chain amino acid aminotransferase
MLKQRVVYFNGKLIPFEQATLHLMSHSLGRASTIFEVLSVHETANGPALFRLDAHVERFMRSAGLLAMALEPTTEQLMAAVCETVAANRLKQGLVKMIGCYTAPAFGLLPPETTLDLAVFAVDPEADLGGLNFPFQTGARLAMAAWRKLDPACIPIQAKAAAHYLNGMLALKEAKARGFDSAVMLDRQGYVAECPTESLFCVMDGQLLTTPLDTTLDSITRRSILQLAAAEGLPAGERRLLPHELLAAQEVFICGTPDKILPVRQIEAQSYTPIPGPLTRRLSRLMERVVTGADERFETWLYSVSL